PPRVIVYGYDRLPIWPVAPPSPDYVPGPEHPPSPDYVPGPEHPPSPIEIPYVPDPEYPEYLAPSDDEAPLEDQPLPANASPIAASSYYMANFDPKEDPEDDQADYPTDGGDGDDEPFDDDDDDDTNDEDPEEEPFEEEEEHWLRPTLLLARKTARPEPPMSASMEACIARHAALPSPSLLVPSLPLPFPSPLTTSLTDTEAPLGYREAGIRMGALLPSTSRRTDILEVDMLPQKRACLNTLTLGFEIKESSAAVYGITDTWDEIVDTLMEIASTTLEGVNERVTELDTIVRQRTDEFELRFEEEQDGRALLRTRVNTLFRDRPDHRYIAMIMDREAMYAREAWAYTKDKSSAIAAHVRTLETQVAALIAQTSSLQTQLTTILGRIKILKAKDLEPQEGPAKAGRSYCRLISSILYSPCYYYDCMKSNVYYTSCDLKENGTQKRTTRATPATTTTPTTTITNAQLQALIDQGVTAALAEHDADRSRNGDNSNDSGTGGRSNCTVACQVKFASCTLQRSALTWWNSHMSAIGQDVAYAMLWAALKRMITGKYCPRGEIQKLESEYLNLKVKGLDLLNYNHRFQELALMCERMFLEEEAKVERYIGGLPDMIHGSVKASKPQSMQEAIEFATEIMDKMMLTHAERKAEQKRKFDDTSRNNQHQQQPFKRNNVARAYTARPGDKKPY
nr:reverse transcriptase domain-containing protein [Tanacetum cinerariifolium]